MQFDQDIIIELIKSNAALNQKMADTCDRIDKALPYMADQHTKLETRVRSVEQKQYWVAGVGTTLGAVAGLLTSFIKH